MKQITIATYNIRNANKGDSLAGNGWGQRYPYIAQLIQFHGFDIFGTQEGKYPQLEDLMIVSDLLVSDYSSIFFDYSIMPKPMLAFCYDYERYASERGMYFDIRDWLPSAKNEDELLNLIQSDKLDNQIEKTQKFKQKFVTSYGSAVKQSLDALYNELSNT